MARLHVILASPSTVEPAIDSRRHHRGHEVAPPEKDTAANRIPALPGDGSSSVSERLRHLGAQSWIDLSPVITDTRGDAEVKARPVGGVVEDVGDQVLPVGLRHHVAIHDARLNEVGIVLVRLVRGSNNFSRELVGRIGIAGTVRLRAAVRVGCIDRVAARMEVHRAILAVAVHWDHRLIDR